MAEAVARGYAVAVGGGEVKRTPLVRKTPMRARRKPLPPRGDTTGPGTPWAQVRLLACTRAGGVCERCGDPFPAYVTDRGEIVWTFDGHHRKLRSQGGPDTIVNCAALCRTCHEWAHRNPEKARERGLIVPREHDPYAWAVILHDGRTVRFDEFGGYDECFEPVDAA